MEELKTILYVIGQTADVQKGSMKHYERDYELIEEIISIGFIDIDDVDALASTYENDLINENYDGAADDWDANRIRYCGKILREIVENF